VSGTGPETVTTSADADAGDRSLAVEALSAAIEAGAVYRYQAGMFPLETTGGQVTIAWDATFGILLSTPPSKALLPIVRCASFSRRLIREFRFAKPPAIRACVQAGHPRRPLPTAQVRPQGSDPPGRHALPPLLMKG
jgi:hypothetical protein